MNLKHWQGYGKITATKTRKTTFTDIYGNKVTQLTISVVGNHEWGIETDDTYTLFNWLFKRFEKSLTDYTQIKSVRHNDYYVKDVEHCDYTFEY